MLTLEAYTGSSVPERSALTNIDSCLRWRHPDLPAPLMAPWTEAPLLVLDRGEPWVVTPAERDPMARDGRTVIPRAAHRTLAAFAERGLEFPRLAIAHQLDAAGAAQCLLPVLEHGPRLCTDDVAQALVGQRPPPVRTARVVRVVEQVLRRGGQAAMTAAEVLLDPIVFGVTSVSEPTHGRVSLWYPLVAWRW